MYFARLNKRYVSLLMILVQSYYHPHPPNPPTLRLFPLPDRRKKDRRSAANRARGAPQDADNGRNNVGPLGRRSSGPESRAAGAQTAETCQGRGNRHRNAGGGLRGRPRETGDRVGHTNGKRTPEDA